MTTMVNIMMHSGMIYGCNEHGKSNEKWFCNKNTWRCVSTGEVAIMMSVASPENNYHPIVYTLWR